MMTWAKVIGGQVVEFGRSLREEYTGFADGLDMKMENNSQ